MKSPSSHESFAAQLADSLSADPLRRTRASGSLSDGLSRGMANAVGGNRPTLAARGLFGRSAFTADLQQRLFDRAFRRS